MRPFSAALAAAPLAVPPSGRAGSARASVCAAGPERRSGRRSRASDAVFVPAPVDELADRGAHFDLVRPRTRSLSRALRGRVDADLAADELQGRRVVQM